MLPSELIVLLAGRRIGVVRRAAGDRLSFVYDDAWRDANDAYPLSLSMPLIEREHGDAPVRAYLEGLVPDRAEVGESWGKRFKLSSKNAYGLLVHVGEDCPGAVQFVTEGSEAIAGAAAPPRTWLSNADIAERLRNAVQVYSTTGASAGARTPADLVLLDLHLPDIPGEMVLHELRAADRTRHVPVLVISADATTRQIERLRAAGARDYLTKPLDVDQFLTAVDAALNSAAD